MRANPVQEMTAEVWRVESAMNRCTEDAAIFGHRTFSFIRGLILAHAESWNSGSPPRLIKRPQWIS